MTNAEKQTVVIEAVRSKLTAADDPDFWDTALTVLTDEFLQRYNRKANNQDWYFLVGACSHWVRPHNSRWSAKGGFVFPEGYQNGTPELDWSVILSRQDESWHSVEKLSGKKQTVLRVAVPARSARHKQAVVHTKWSTFQEPVLYGFRRLEGSWQCVAASDEGSQGSISLAVNKSKPNA
jgi:hypothetical protein